MAFDWLFGPRTFDAANNPGGLYIDSPLGFRAVVIDTDDVVDTRDNIVRTLNLIDGVTVDRSAIMTLNRAGDDETRTVSDEELVNLNDFERSALQVWVTYSVRRRDAPDAQANFYVNLGVNNIPQVTAAALPIPPEYHLQLTELRAETANRIVRAGTPRIQWHRFLAYAVFLPWVTLAVSMGFIQATTSNVALSLFGWLLTGFALFGTWRVGKWVYERYRLHNVGCLIRGETRATTRARRANRKRDLTVGILVALVTFALTQGGNWIADMSKAKSDRPTSTAPASPGQ